MKKKPNASSNGHKSSRVQALTVDRLAVIIVCNPSRRRDCIRTIMACTQHFDPDQVHVVNYGSVNATTTTTTAAALLEETLAELDLHTVPYSYVTQTVDPWCAAAAALGSSCGWCSRRYTHILLVDTAAAQRPTHLQRGLQHFSTQSTLQVFIQSSQARRSASSSAAAGGGGGGERRRRRNKLSPLQYTWQRMGGGIYNKNRQQQQQQQQQSSSSSSFCSSTEMMKLQGGNYQFQFNLWDRRALLAYLQEYQDCLERQQQQQNQNDLTSGGDRSFVSMTRDYAPIAFY